MTALAVTACGKKDPTQTTADHKASVQTELLTKLKICEGETACISSKSALVGLYGQEPSTINVAVVPNFGTLTVFAASRVKYEKADFAVFLVEGKKWNSDFHAAPANLGVMVYQFVEGQWRVFAFNELVDKYGSYGSVVSQLSRKHPIQFIPVSQDRFLIALTTTYTGMGIETETMSIIDVKSGVAGSKTRTISSIGDIEVSHSDCLGTSAGDDWDLTNIQFDTTGTVLGMTGVKKFKKNCTKEYVEANPIALKYKATNGFFSQEGGQKEQ